MNGDALHPPEEWADLHGCQGVYVDIDGTTVLLAEADFVPDDLDHWPYVRHSVLRERAFSKLHGSPATYADPADFCERHAGNSVVRRCCHLGNRYVAEMRLHGEEKGYIDYVEDAADGGLIVEPGGPLDRVGLQVEWDRQIARMRAGEAPMPDR